MLAQQRPITEPLTERKEKLLAVLESNGASFFDPLHQAVGGGYPGESIESRRRVTAASVFISAI